MTAPPSQTLGVLGQPVSALLPKPASLLIIAIAIFLLVFILFIVAFRYMINRKPRISRTRTGDEYLAYPGYSPGPSGTTASLGTPTNGTTAKGGDGDAGGTDEIGEGSEVTAEVE